MKKILICALLGIFYAASASAQTYCLKATKVGQTPTTLTVIFTLSSSFPTPLQADATLLIIGGGGVSGAALAGNSFNGNLLIGAGLSYQVANSSQNPSGTYDFQVVNKQIPATFSVFDQGFLGVYVPQKIPLDPGCPLNQIALPVELLSFTAVKNNTAALVSWQTASEKNVAHFEVERSRDGINFATIGSVKAAGNSVAAEDYFFTDERVLPGVNYYRLKSVDLDGQTAYSKTASVEFAASASIQVYPNPVSETLTVESGAAISAGGETSVEIFDMEGRLVYQKSVQPEKQGWRLTIATADFAAGAYMVRVNSGGGIFSQKITKL